MLDDWSWERSSREKTPGASTLVRTAMAPWPGVSLAEFSTLRISAVVPESVLRLSILNGIVNPLIRGL